MITSTDLLKKVADRSLIILLFVMGPCFAETDNQPPNLIALGPLLQRLTGPTGSNHSTNANLANVRASISLANLLPVDSHRLTPGTVNAQQRKTHLLQPLFLVGCDPSSLAWLKANHDRLQQIHATGLLVQASTLDDLNAVQQAAPGLPLIPASGDAFAETLSLTHYPVLITHAGLSP